MSEAAGQDQDQVMIEIGKAVELFRAGEVERARHRFDELWRSLADTDADPLHRCALAHYAADAQEDVAAELEWDLRALAAVEDVTDERAQQVHHSLAVAAFYPSLHLNLAEDHRRLGDLDRAREHLERARGTAHVLGDDDYGRGITEGIERTAAAIAGASPSG